MSLNNYERKHSAEKKKAVDERGLFCEITGQSGDSSQIEAHHSMPRYLSGPDHKSNYLLLEKSFHKALHDETWSDHPHLIAERKRIRKFLRKHPDHVDARRRLESIDAVLIPEYIHKLLNKLPYDVREKVNEATHNASFCTIRDLTLEILSLRQKLEEVQNEGSKSNRNVVSFKKKRR